MANYRSPGVFNKEIDDSLTVRGVSTSVVGMVGLAEKGPIATPVLVTSLSQFQEVFGSYIAAGYLAHAAKAFFEEGGSVLYAVRTAHYTDITDPDTLTADTATITLDEAGDGATGSLQVDAVSPGTWANGLQAKVENVLTDYYDLLILDAGGTVLERYVSVTNLENDDRFVEVIVNQVSRQVRVTALKDDPPVEGDDALAGGDDGLDDLADSDYIGDASARNGLHSFGTTVPIKLIAVPGVNSTAVHTALLAFAESRETMFAVLGSSQGDEPADVLTHRATLAGGYGALYWPWVYTANPQTGLPMLVPPEGHVLGVYARNDHIAVWSAPAGLNRARLRTALGVAYDSTQGERDELYDKQVNVVATFIGKGSVIWGQKVLLDKPSALDRVNVRRLLNYIKESVQSTSEYLVFEPNDERTWRAFVRYMDPFLGNIRQRRGLYDFRVVCDATTNTAYYIDNNIMVGKVFVKPTRTAEFLELQYIVTGAGANFSEL